MTDLFWSDNPYLDTFVKTHQMYTSSLLISLHVNFTTKCCEQMYTEVFEGSILVSAIYF